METFAGQAALALERARAQEERELIAVLGDRERIARDLHDVVIQRLFAAGMQLQGAARRAAKPEVQQRIDEVVDALDTTIRDIRGAIFELRSPGVGDVRARIRELVAEARDPLGFRPQLILDGPLDSMLTDQLAAALLAVLREALSNAARHARCTELRVRVGVGGGQLQLTVTDNGVGRGASAASNGRRNMRARAEELGGTFALGDAEPRGTTLTWAVPVDR
jgi:signal transduction histidine kinase